MKRTREFALISERLHEALRECGILWLVFSLLDRTVAGQLTVPWTFWNFSVAIALWSLGIYIEMKAKR
jgi:hypothetical protein